MKTRLLVLLSLALLFLIAVLVWPDTERWGLFLGRFHSTVVHFPIAFLLLAGGLEVYQAVRSAPSKREIVALVLILAAGFSGLAAITGYLLSFEGGFSQRTLSWHLRLGVIVAVASNTSFFLLLLWRFFAVRWALKGYQVLLGLTIPALLMAGHLGGVLAHGSDYLTAYLPPSILQVVGLQAETAGSGLLDPEEAMVFDDLVLPILRQQCGECHNENRRKGGLDLVSRVGLDKGGDSGKILVEGDSQGSELIRRMTLSPTEEGRMPPGSRSLVDIGEIEVIRWWIDHGAPFDLRVRDRKDPPFPVSTYLKRILMPGEEEPKGILARDVPSPPEEALDRLRGAGFMVGFLADGRPFLSARFPQGRVLDSRAMESLIPVAQQVTWLDLSGTVLDPGWADVVSQMESMTRLNLAMTNATEADLALVGRLPYLEVLNLYGTVIGDEGLVHLSSLENLRSLYLWQTQVTEEAALEFQGSRDGLVVNLGEALGGQTP